MPSFWGRLTSTEKSRTIVVSVVAFVFVFLVAFLAGFFIAPFFLEPAAPLRTSITHVNRTDEKVNPKGDINICSTPDCIQTASQLLLKLDENVDPCDDFYDFACGTFLKSTRIPDDESVVSAITETTIKVRENIRLLLEEPITNDELRPFMLAKTVYQACMNTTLIEARGLQPVLDMLQRLGGWPVLDGDSWNESFFSWKDSVYRFRDAGYHIGYFLEFFVSRDLKNNTLHIINLDEAGLGLNREYLIHGFSDKQVLAYYDYMVDIAKLLGAEGIRAKDELEESLQFEINLAKISLTKEKKRNATSLYNPMTIEQLIIKYPSISWLEYINRLLAPHATVGPEENIILKVPNYITDLEKLLKVTPKRVQANYVMWRVVSASISYLTEALLHRKLAFTTALTGQTKLRSRWKDCLDATKTSMPIAVGALYVRKYFNEKSKTSVLEIVDDIRQQFRKILTEVDWMDNQTRKKALEKADAMISHIAYSQELLDNNKLTEFYFRLHVSPEKWMESALNLSIFNINESFKKLREPWVRDKTDWDTQQPANVNAHFSHLENCIKFPAGILQGGYFALNRPAFMNYGAIGSIIGHEITHGFDDRGRQYDKNGNLVNWWCDPSKQSFLEKAKCIVDQYSNYTVTEVGLKLNGLYTQGENIADNGGTKEAYYAYEAWTKRHGEEHRLPGLEKYTPKQLFWISVATIRCAVYRGETLKMRVITNKHSPSRFRVIGPLSNMDEFAQDFNCPPGSQMNPHNKCKVW